VAVDNRRGAPALDRQVQALVHERWPEFARDKGP